MMKKIGLRSLIRKKYKLTTDSKHSFKIADNLLKRDFSVDGLSQKWVGDVRHQNKQGGTYPSRELGEVDKRRMAFIASIMSTEQSKARTEKNRLSPFQFWSVFVTKPNKRTPTKQEFDNWQNTKVYGVWIDGKKAKNTELKKLKNTDVVLYYVSKLHGKAKAGRSYTHQLNVYTQPYYDKAFKDRKEDYALKNAK